jgi:hypothetical protein
LTCVDPTLSGTSCLCGLPTSVKSFPLSVAFPRVSVLRLIRLPLHIRRASPFTVLLRLPVPLSTPPFRFPPNPVSGFPLACLNSALPYLGASHGQERLGPPKFFDVSLASHAQAFRRTSTPKPFGRLVVASGSLRPSPSAPSLSRSCTNTKGERGLPYGLQDSLSTLRLSCSPLPRLRHRRKTRYGWVASPYPTGTLTLLDTPSFSWRDNMSLERRRAFCGVRLEDFVRLPLCLLAAWPQNAQVHL